MAAAKESNSSMMPKPVTREYIRNLRGSLKNKKVWEAFLHDRRKDRES